MTANTGWPGKPGVPMNPERDDWHWMKTPDNEVMPFEWRAEGECERGHWPSYWVSQGEDCWTAEECEYLGPVLSHDQATALQKKGCARDQTTTQYCAEAVALQARVAELEVALKEAAASVGEWGAYASQYLQDKWDLPGEVARYIAIAEGKNDAALTGGKDG